MAVQNLFNPPLPIHHKNTTPKALMADKRLPIFPTRMNLKIVSNKEKSAEKGWMLLKRKSDALKQKYKMIEREFNEKQTEISKSLNDAFFKLSEAEFLGGNIPMYIHECQKQPMYVTLALENISGVSLTRLELDKSSLQPIFCLDRSGPILNECRTMFLDVLEKLVSLCALKNSFIILEQVLMATNRRVNALEFSIIPKLTNTISYINSELDEQDREDFFRLKKIQNLKNKQ